MRNLAAKTICFFVLAMLSASLSRAESSIYEDVTVERLPDGVTMISASVESNILSASDELKRLTDVALGSVTEERRESVNAASFSIKHHMATRFMQNLAKGDKSVMTLIFGKDNSFTITFEFENIYFKVVGHTEKTNPKGSFKSVGVMEIRRDKVTKKLSFEVLEKYDHTLIGEYKSVIEENPTEAAK